MIGVAIRFDLGRAHATPWGSHVNEAAVEWPPCPWRIMRALLAVTYAHADLVDDRATLRNVLRALAAASPPAYVLPPATAAHTRHYYPLPGWSPTNAGETSLVVDAFLALDPAAELQVIWEADLAADERRALERAAAAIGYLGRSESVCSVRVIDRLDDAPNALPATAEPEWSSRARDIELWTVEPGKIETLEISVGDLRKARRLMPDGVRRVPYVVLDAPAPVAQSAGGTPRATLAHLRMRGGTRPSLHDAITVSFVLRAALQRRFDDIVGGGASRIFSGHGADGRARRDQHQHAHYLVGSDRGAKRADHLWVWAPGGMGDDEVAAIASLRRLRFREHPEPYRVALAALGDDRSLRIEQLHGPSATWQSATPFLLPRHQKRRGGRVVDGPIEQIARELSYRGFPDPEAIELVPGPWTTFKLTRPGVSRRMAPHAVGAVIRFPEQVRGPIAIGAHSHFALGRFEPVM